MPRSFTETLADLAGGEILNDLTEQLAQVVKAVEETGKVGALTLTIKIGTNGEGAMQVQADIKTKEPQPVRGTTILFHNSDGSLTRNNPKQGAFDFKPKVARAE
jgi:hypothetical protein